MRCFRHLPDGPRSLVRSPDHSFAMRHALHIFAPNAVCSAIAGNLEVPLRYAVARANGCARGPEDLIWIEKDEHSFAPDLRTAFAADYAFAVLACPYRRLLQTFRDTFIPVRRPSWNLYNLTDRRIHPLDITFRDFVAAVRKLPDGPRDDRWRRQTDFLLYEEYDDLFAAENFAALADRLRAKIGLGIVELPESDTPAPTIQGYDDGASIPALQLLTMHRKGVELSDASFFDDRIVSQIASSWRDDIALYRDAGFGKLLMFDR